MNENLVYTGVGSREERADPKAMALATQIAIRLYDAGFTLRSGAADGMDAAFEAGSKRNEIYLPKEGFNGHRTGIVLANMPNRYDAEKIAAKVHPVFSRLRGFPRNAHTRNVYQVLGGDLQSPSQFLVCWTPNGEYRPEHCNKNTGGTATAIKLACMYGVPVFNLAVEKHKQIMLDYVSRN